MRHKLGALPPRVPVGLSDLASYVNGRLPTPPKEVADPAVADWGMDGIDQYGDCTMAAAAHCIAAWDVEVAGSDPIPDDAETVSEYRTITGSVAGGDAKDTGLVLSDVLRLWSGPGLFGDNKIAAYAPIRIQSILALLTL